MRVLILALSGIGDALMFTPALSILRKHQPDAVIDALVMFRGVEDMYKRTGLLNSTMFFDFMQQGPAKSLAFLLKLRKQYDVTINVYPANRKEYNGINFLLGAPKRGAVQYKRMDLQNLGFLNTHRVQEVDTLHNVQENLAVVKKLFGITDDTEPALLFPLLPEDEQFADSFLAANNLQGVQLIGMHAGCSTLKNHINRRWEPEKFAELGRRILTENNTALLLFGGPEEKELKQEILKGINSPRAFFVESKNLAQSAALIQRCSLFITNDSSQLHVASAMQRKIVAIIGPTNTHYIHPWKTEYTIASLKLPCAPCFFYSPKPLSCSRTDKQYKCIKDLSVDLVLEAVKKYL